MLPRVLRLEGGVLLMDYGAGGVVGEESKQPAGCVRNSDLRHEGPALLPSELRRMLQTFWAGRSERGSRGCRLIPEAASTPGPGLKPALRFERRSTSLQGKRSAS